MLSANNKHGHSAEKNKKKQRQAPGLREDLNEKLLSLNDIMMQASQNKNKIDAEKEKQILDRAKAFCQGRDGKQIPNQE